MSEPYLDPRVAEMSAATGLTYVQVARFASIAGHKLSNYAALALVGELVRRRADALFSFYPATGMIVITVPSREATFSFVSDALLEEVYVQGTWCDSVGRHRSGTTSLPRGAVRALGRALKLDWVAARISDAATELRKRGQLGLAAEAEHAARAVRRRSR